MTTLHHFSCPKCSAKVGTIDPRAEVWHRCPANGRKMTAWRVVLEPASIAKAG